MHPIRKRPVVEEVEEALARKILFRDDDDLTFLGTIEAISKELTVSVGVVREALQRLLTLGLVQHRNARFFMLPAIPRVFGVEGLRLAVRSAREPWQREMALRSLLEMLEYLLIESISRCTAKPERPQRDPSLSSELSTLEYVLRRHADREDVLKRLDTMIRVAASESDCGPLTLLATTTLKAVEPARPWLAAAIDDVEFGSDWGALAELHDSGNAEGARSRITELMSRYRTRVLALAGNNDPMPDLDVPTLRSIIPNFWG